MPSELYKRYRPKTLERVIGNDKTVATLQNMIKRKTIPHTMLFHGPSGCGKTTMARILKRALKCSNMDFRELNCSDFRGIDTVRDIARNMNLSPSAGECRIWLLDEVHQLSRDGQNAALKILEDTPEHVYFFLCTTDPQKLLKTIRTRCCEMPVCLLSHSEMKKLIHTIAKREKIKINNDHIEDIVDAAGGSARSGLVMLDKVANLSEEEREDVLSQQENEREGIELCRAIWKREPWPKIAKLIKEIKSDPETLRWSILGYAKSILLNKGDDYAYHIITCFENNFYDSKDCGLVRACYEALNGESEN